MAIHTPLKLKTKTIKEDLYESETATTPQMSKITLANITESHSEVGEVNTTEVLYFDNEATCDILFDGDEIEDTSKEYYVVVTRDYELDKDTASDLITVDAPTGKKLKLCGIFAQGAATYNDDYTSVICSAIGMDYSIYADNNLIVTLSNPDDNLTPPEMQVDTGNAYPYLIILTPDNRVFPYTLLANNYMFAPINWINCGEMYSQKITSNAKELDSEYLINMIKLANTPVCSSFSMQGIVTSSQVSSSAAPRNGNNWVAIFKLVDA